MPIQFTNLPFRKEHWDKLNKQITDRIHYTVSEGLMFLKEHQESRYKNHCHRGMDISHWFSQNEEEFINKWGTPVPVEGVPTWVYTDQRCFANLVGQNWESYWLIHTDQGKWVRIIRSEEGEVKEGGEMKPTQWGDEPYFGKLI